MGGVAFVGLGDRFWEYTYWNLSGRLWCPRSSDLLFCKAPPLDVATTLGALRSGSLFSCMRKFCTASLL